MYRIEGIVSYRYHKTDTSIVSKWQINDTFKDTFYDDINKDRASLPQKWMIFFLLNACFVFHFDIIWKIMVPEYYYTVCWVYQKATRDVYRIEGIVLYRYHKTDTSIVSKWQINDTFKNTFYDDINKDRASLPQKWMIFFIKCMFCFSFWHHLENDGPWILLYCMLSIPKGH